MCLSTQFLKKHTIYINKNKLYNIKKNISNVIHSLFKKIVDSFFTLHIK